VRSSNTFGSRKDLGKAGSKQITTPAGSHVTNGAKVTFMTEK